jgi:hypothetical protein
LIEIWSYRKKEGPEILLSNRYAEIEEAIVSLLKYELGYGGRVTVLTDEKIEVETLIFHCKDRTVFSGSKEEMQDLLATAYLWLKAEKEVSFDNWHRKVSEVTNGVPLRVVMAAGILQGELVREKLREQLGAA